MRFPNLVVWVLVLACACQSTGPRATGPVDEAIRKQLFERISGLAGKWQTTSPQGEKAVFEFQTTSGGSVVREVMFPGTAHEMTNMYHLDGNTLVMTHYCAGGTQPRMRAQRGGANELVFRCDSVTDLKAPDEVYMGSMTLVVDGPDRVREIWKAYKGQDVDHEMTFQLTRTR